MSLDQPARPAATSHSASGFEPALIAFADIVRTTAAEEGKSQAATAAMDRIVEAGRALVAERRRGEAKVEIVDAQNGTGAAILHILNSDMPFLVDSIAGELHARSLYPALLVHPTFKAMRDAAGRLTDIRGRGDADWSDDAQESYIAAVLPPLTAEARRDLVLALEDILAEVRASVRDWRAMLEKVGEVADRLERSPPGNVAADLIAESVAFLRWLVIGNFTFLGVREHRVVSDGSGTRLVAVPGSGLGLLERDALDPLDRRGMTPATAAEINRYVLAAQPLIITKSSLVSRIHRRVLMDYVGIKTYEGGQVTGELRLAGLLTSAAYNQPPDQIPLLRRKVERVMQQSGFAAHSHNAKALANVLVTFPRDELFRIGEPLLLEWGRDIVDLGLRPRTRLFFRWDRFERFVSALVYLPRDRYSGSVREAVGAMLAAAFAGRVSASEPYFPDGPVVRIQFIIGRGEGPRPDVDGAALEAEIDERTRTWPDRLARAFAASDPALSALIPKYAAAFPPGYVAMFSAARAVDDIARIERLGPERQLAIDFYREPNAPPSQIRATLYRFDDPIPLSERVPVLENLGFRVIDERSYDVAPSTAAGARRVVLHDMVLEDADGAPVALDGLDTRLEDCFLAVFARAADNDAFNKLVMKAGATWREAALLRTIASYLRQAGAPFSPNYVAATLTRHAGIARDLIELFRTRHDPEFPRQIGNPSDRDEANAADKVRARIDGALAMVQSLDEDRIIRRCLNVLDVTLRTNFFQTGETGAPHVTIAIKLDSRAIDQLPEPRPYREIFVHSPRVEGVHLRFGPIARGGIRWSDRPQDFRTEVLGLAKAQVVKNTVIVPTGSKGGFVPRWLRPTASRDEAMREAIAAYESYIGTLLSITDNIVGGKVVPPDRVVRHDGDDPYLVVAADKGTATFSDYANAISVERGFWLGDAFASGGSAGYDHKRMGITARGAWECVKRHFRELDVDIQTNPFSVIGVGDMSGDVFGNAMLLSPATRLIAAFDHRDIFLDPDPDPAVSLAERRRLFDLPRSSWRDYDTARISPGGGVHSRSAKSIPLSVQVQSMLGGTVAAMTPAELITALLKMKVDLLWFGGIGTFVRATSETDEQVGDRANDAVRITAAELGARVIGEGANLGITQRGRIEAAGRGIKLNADFIDNSAGVNTSDQEVNIKIALGPAVASGRLAEDERLALLAAMTGDVATACLANNYQQSLAISLAERTSRQNLGYLARLAAELEARKLLDRRLESMPSRAELAARMSAGQGMARPEVCVLLSYAKIALDKDLLAGPAPSDAALAPMLSGYFPPALRDRFAADIAVHPLAREIVSARITNSLINRGGPAMVVRLADETGRTASDIASAAMAAREILGLPGIWDAIDALDGKIVGEFQLDLYAATQALLLDAASHLLRLPGNGGLSQMIERYKPVVMPLLSAISELMTPSQKAKAEARHGALIAASVPAELAHAFAGMPWWRSLLAVPEIATAAKSDPRRAASVLLAATEYLGLPDISERAAGLSSADYYDRLAINGAIAALSAAVRSLATRALANGVSEGGALSDWIATRVPHMADARTRLDTLTAGGELTVARLTVGAQQVRDLAGG